MSTAIPARAPFGRRSLLRVAAALLGVAALTAIPALPAQGHDSLGESSPASGATVTTAPRAVTLGFEEAVLDYPDTTVLVVTGPVGAARHFETACPRIDGRTVSAAVALGDSGRYTVTWRVVSDDGHPVSGSFAFRLQRPAGTAPSAGSTSGPNCGGGAKTGAGTATSGSTGPSTAVSPVVWTVLGIGAGLVLVLVVVVVVIAVRLRGRPAKETAARGPGSA
jgi:copper resistance protein C